MTIPATETRMTGQWLVRDGSVVGDQTCARIDELVRSRLQRVGSDSSGWDTLYRDTDDGRLWELTYPQSHMHGGGPPQLAVIALDEARTKYGDIAG